MLAPSCSLFHKSSRKAVPPPATPVPATQPAPQAPPKPEQVTLPSPPQISPERPDVSQQKPPVPAQAGTLPPPPKRRRGRPAKQTTTPEAGTTAGGPAAAQAPPAAGQQTPAAQQPPANEAAVPQLEEILSPEQRQAFNEAIDRDLARAQRALESLQGRRLNREQRTNFERVQTFMQQATDSRKVDLPRAKNLADRASVLADDLLRTAQ